MSPGGAEEIKKHLDSCSHCGSKYGEMLKNNHLLERARDIIDEAGKDEEIDVNRAWRRLSREISGEKYFYAEEKIAMKQRYKKMAAAAVAGAALFAMFSFGPVRATAADMLKIFRVDKIQTIAINPSDLTELETIFREKGGKVDIRNFGTVESTGKVTATKATLDEAGKAVDFPLSMPREIPEGYTAPVYTVYKGMQINFNLNTEAINSSIKSLGGDKFLPRELDGKTFSLRVPDAVNAEYKSSDGGRELLLAQARSPEIRVPSGVDENTVRDALLSIPVLPDNLRKQLAAINDWQHTLPVPNINGSTTEVTVNGEEGVYIKANAGHEQRQVNSLVWHDNGVIRMICGDDLTLDQATAIASSMK